MIPVRGYKGAKVAVLGLGRSGLSAARSLRAGGAEALVWDDNEEARARAEAEKTDEDLLEELGLPDPDMLQPGDDFSAFMQKAVPERLRRRALRRLWTSNPVLANLDGLTEYSEDFTDAATVLPDLRTAYEVGRGMYEHVRTLAAKALEEGDLDRASAVRGMKEDVTRRIEAVSLHQMQRLRAKEPRRLPTYAREIELTEALDDIFRTIRSIAKSQLMAAGGRGRSPEA